MTKVDRCLPNKSSTPPDGLDKCSQQCSDLLICLLCWFVIWNKAWMWRVMTLFHIYCTWSVTSLFSLKRQRSETRHPPPPPPRLNGNGAFMINEFNGKANYSQTIIYHWIENKGIFQMNSLCLPPDSVSPVSMCEQLTMLTLRFVNWLSELWTEEKSILFIFVNLLSWCFHNCQHV